MHLTWSEASCDRVLPRAWRVMLWPAYAVALTLPAGALMVLLGKSVSAANELAMKAISSGLSLMFVWAAIYSIALISRHHPKATDQRKRWSRLSLLGMFGLMALLFVFLLAVNALGGLALPSLHFTGDLVEIAAKSLPLVFMFVGTYYENRFRFFDLLVKRGLAMMIALVGLTLWFAVALPMLTRTFERQWAAPWIYAIALLPVVLGIRWGYARLSTVLDRHWLGRRFTTVEAVKHFLSGLRSATTESQLVERAQAELAGIFGARAAVHIGPGPFEPGFEVHQETEISSSHGVLGRFLMGPRQSEGPYFSEDVALLASLADVFASVLDNLHLQERKLEQEQRARELSLHASRSELKALRAQINPHFLFNALNSIAGLIHREPAMADRTIEQLADVFRYALRGAESEWAILDDELDFVRAYLEVERARFGERLHTAICIEDGARGARIPTMIVQTLVENAVKHGVAAVRGQASVLVSAREASGQLVVSVTDNGPGFDVASTQAAPRAQGGYGLVNIRQRLEGYFGSSAALVVERSGAPGLTTVSLSLPLVRQEPRPKQTLEPAR
jgi:signal transduction histidine kinase